MLVTTEGELKVKEVNSSLTRALDHWPQPRATTIHTHTHTQPLGIEWDGWVKPCTHNDVGSHTR